MCRVVTCMLTLASSHRFHVFLVSDVSVLLKAGESDRHGNDSSLWITPALSMRDEHVS